MTVFVKHCLHCMDSKTGEKIRRPLGETVHTTRPGEVLHFDFLYVGDSGLLGKDGFGEGDGFKYILVMMGYLSNFAWLEPTESCTAASTAKHLLRSCKTLGVPEVWVGDIASHFKNHLMKTLGGVLRVEDRCAFSVFFPFILDIKFVGRTSRGYTGGRSHRIFHPSSFCGAHINFSREEDSAIPFPRRP